MKTLSLRKALQECARIWDQLATSGDTSKPASAKRYKYECPCCEYVCIQLPYERTWGMACCKGTTGPRFANAIELCPLNKLWPKGCCADKSPFSEWMKTGTVTTRRRYAKVIANAARKALKKLK